MIVHRDALARAASRTYYLDLDRLARLQDERGTPFTPAVHAYGLVEALREFTEEGGRSARHRRYAALAEQVRMGLAELGSAGQYRRGSRRWCCVLTGFRRASSLRCCMMP